LRQIIPTSERIRLVPNLGQPVTKTAIRGRCGGALSNRRSGGIDTRKLRGRSRQQGGRRRRLQDSLRGDHLQRAPPIPGGPIEREQASQNGRISRQSEQASRDAGGDTSTNKICRSAPRPVVIRLLSHVHGSVPGCWTHTPGGWQHRTFKAYISQT